MKRRRNDVTIGHHQQQQQQQGEMADGGLRGHVVTFRVDHSRRNIPRLRVVTTAKEVMNAFIRQQGRTQRQIYTMKNKSYNQS